MTPKQEAFCQGIADGLNQSDAYRHAYETVNMGSEAVKVEASRLMDHPDIALTIMGLKQANQASVTEKRAWDTVRFIDEAEVNLNLARELKQIAPANGALGLIGDATGITAKHVEVTGLVTHALVDVSPDKLRAMAEAYELLEAKIVDADEA